MRYAQHMEPISNVDLAMSFALAVWPIWFVLAALLVLKLASRFGYCPPDEEAPCGCSFGQCCGFCRGCCLEDRLAREAKYHGDDSVGR